MAPLNVSVALLCAFPLTDFRTVIELAIGVSTATDGQPVLGLLESEIQILIACRDFQVFYPKIIYTREVPIVDENMETIDIDYQPGPARPLGLPGYYRMVLLPPSGSSWPLGNVAIEVVVAVPRAGGIVDRGQALTGFEVIFRGTA
jgi:hypothetical protein